MAASSPNRLSADGAAFTVRDARPADTDAFMQVIALADPLDPDPFGLARVVLASPPVPPLSHDRNLALVAEDKETGTFIGALFGGPPRWLFTHPGIDSLPLLDHMVRSLGIINGVAVHPDHRRRGVAAALIGAAEQRFARAGYGLVTVDHEPALDGFYRRHGYTIGDALLVHLPQQRLIGMTTDDTRMSAKPLHPAVRLADVPGAPHRVITGLLPGASLPADAVFDGTRLQY
ncbi:N-acetyltransferase [Streptomyces sp. NPDC048659]|uniref:GNAT family N-acetyltransferase n=1 Tax=Streptomyces sp. NPDC048659 TaxID=3155489 RepID=UPI00344A76D3